jgi:hypothetical protein
MNQYCTGFKCVSYSVTQVKSQLHEKINNILYNLLNYYLFIFNFLQTQYNGQADAGGRKAASGVNVIKHFYPIMDEEDK